MARRDRDFDITRPHPGSGLLFSGNPSPHAEAAERAARDALEVFCDICGSANAGNGFGSFSHSRGVIACSDPECCREARERAAERLRAPAAPTAAADLFTAQTAGRRAA